MSIGANTQSSRGAQSLLVLLAALGVVAFLYGVTRPQPAGTWGIYLVNLLFWSSFAITGPAIAGDDAAHGGALVADREADGADDGGIPARVVRAVPGAVPRPRVALPVGDDAGAVEEAAWLNVPFMSLRIGLGVLLLYWVALLFSRAVVAEHQAGGDTPAALARRNRLGAILLALYVVVLSLWGFDLIMTIDPIWYSGLFGGYYVVTSLYPGFALVTFLVIRSNAQGVTRVSPSAIQDVAKLTFAMCVFWAYFFYSQYLVIWYGNVPVETRFFLRRFFEEPWKYARVLHLRDRPDHPVRVPAQAADGPASHTPQGLHRDPVHGMDRDLPRAHHARVPVSMSKSNTFPLGPVEILITAGFFALFVLSRNWFLGRFRPAFDLPR